jgi:hypothetical protein
MRSLNLTNLICNNKDVLFPKPTLTEATLFSLEMFTVEKDNV